VQDGTLLTREWLERLWAPQVRESPTFAYAHLWGVEQRGAVLSVGHNGGAPGVSADFRIFPEIGWTVIVLSNRSRQAAPLAEWIADVAASSHDLAARRDSTTSTRGGS
jgi:hypothetical protein